MSRYRRRCSNEQILSTKRFSFNPILHKCEQKLLALTLIHPSTTKFEIIRILQNTSANKSVT